MKEDSLCTILRHSHEQALNGNTYTMEFVEQFMDNKVYELTNQMDINCVAESIGCI